jgi:hypothetical protein
VTIDAGWRRALAKRVRPSDKGVMRTLAIALALGAGCRSRTAPAPKAQWQRVDGTKEPFETARTACEQEALENTKGVPHQSTATQAAAGIFVDCMRRRGWVQAGGDAR